MESQLDAEAITKAFGKVISTYRETHGLTRPKLAELTGLSVQTIQKLEGADQGNFNIDSFVRIAASQGKSLAELMSDLEAEAGMQTGKVSPDVAVQHVLKNHVAPETQTILVRAASKETKEGVNELGWGMTVSGVLLSLEEKDRQEFELAIRRKDPNRNDPKAVARIRELLHKTTFD